jgi:hypothetical protein
MAGYFASETSQLTSPKQKQLTNGKDHNPYQLDRCTFRSSTDYFLQQGYRQPEPDVRSAQSRGNDKNNVYADYIYM